MSTALDLNWKRRDTAESRDASANKGLVHFVHVAAVHHSWRTFSPYLHVGLQGRDWHWTSLDYWLSTDLFLSPPHCRLATWTYLLQFVFTSPQSIKSQNRHAKNESPRGGNRCHKPRHAAGDHSQGKRHLAAGVVNKINKRQSRIEQEAASIVVFELWTIKR